MEYLIRELKKTDLNTVINLLQQISKYEPLLQDYSRIWKEFDSKKNIYAVVAELNCDIIGYGCLSYSVNIRGGKIAYIEDIICNQNYRKKGLGRAIVKELGNYAKKKGCYKVVLQCKEENKKFYEKSGYKINGFCMQKFL